MNIELLHKVEDVTALVVGDFMIDKYIDGHVSRISPEAPVPVLEVKKKKSKLGGAGNVVNNLAMLGTKVKVIGCIGNDDDGNWLRKKLLQWGCDVSYLQQDSEVKTISKTRLVSKKQQFLRYDEEIVKDVPEHFVEEIQNHLVEIFDSVDILILSDYGKGTIREDLAQILIQYAKEREIPIIVDPKGINYMKYSGATVCTPNMNELRTVTGEKIESEDELKTEGVKLKTKCCIDNLMVTRSEKGISLIQGEEVKKDFPAAEKDVIDVTGAGDTVVSIVAACMGVGYSIEESCVIANIAASIVCSKFGTATVSLNELINGIINSGEFKKVDITSAKYIVSSIKEKGKKVVFTNGCFDLLHAGHISSFLQARKYGDILIVAVNSDESVRTIKGNKRPIISQSNRIKMLCGLDCVDYVVVMNDTTPENIIKILQPDIVVKGKDWEGKKMPEQKIINEYGGEMKFINLEEGLSTTNIIKKIIEVYGKEQ